MEQSPHLSLSYVMPAQAQKHVTVNESFRRLDALTQMSVVSRSETAEPASPAQGDAYILPADASGDAWDSYDEHDIAVYQDGAWARIAPSEGFRAWISDDDEFVVFDGAAWTELSGGGGSSETAAKFGINTAADAANKLAVKSDAVLFNHDDVTPGSGDCQVKINKNAADDTGSLLFQTGASGRAEFGLAGDDDFHIKVSPDGASWLEALVIDKDTGEARFRAAGEPLTSVADDTSDAMLVLRNYVSSAGGGKFRIERARGTEASPAAVAANDIIGGFFINAHDGSEFSGNVCFAGFRAHQDFTPSAQGTCYEIATTSDGATSRTTRGVWYEGLLVGSATGGDKGAGTVNAEAVYDDNSLLSCYVFDQALDGTVVQGKWDAKVPDRRIIERDDDTAAITRDETIVRLHEPLRKFTARIGTDYDPLTLDGYAKHWKEKRHLTAMPNEAGFDPTADKLAAGEWIQRLVETVEIQAVLIEALNERVKAVEARARA